MKKPRHIITEYCNNATRELRELEDYARLELGGARGEILADRAREIYAAIRTDIIEGSSGQLTITQERDALIALALWDMVM